MTVHPAALVLTDHQTRPHAWPQHNAGVMVTCRCLNWEGWDYDHPAHLADVLVHAGLLAPASVMVEEAPEGDPGMEAVQAWFRNGGC